MSNSLPRPPRVSVIIATYNWSAALKCALQSVLNQTVSDFEVLVIGDACTDGTEALVASFGDPRLKFMNLSQRCGSQYAPNNHGLDHAQGAFIAYLGHDDIWWPDHLETSLRALEDQGADVSAALTILYGPAGSGVYAVTGLFPGDQFDPHYFFVPSSMVHRATALASVGPWRSVEESARATDVDLVFRLHEQGLRVVPTRTLSVFKFNAAWRRNSYIDKTTYEQQALLAKIGSGVDFRQEELTKVMCSVIDSRFQHILATPEPTAQSIEAQYQARRFKGSAPPFESLDAVSRIEGSRRLEMAGDYMGFEWYGLETTPAGMSFRWSGPGVVSSLPLPLQVDAACIIEIEIVSTLAPDVLEGLKLEVNGCPVEFTMRQDVAGTILTCHFEPDTMTPAEAMTVRFTINRTWQPSAMGINPGDKRWLGLAVGAITVRPYQNG